MLKGSPNCQQRQKMEKRGDKEKFIPSLNEFLVTWGKYNRKNKIRKFTKTRQKQNWTIRKIEFKFLKFLNDWLWFDMPVRFQIYYTLKEICE